MKTNLPSRARVVIVGGGAVGCGVAYALAEAGYSDILLVERAEELGQITTSQGAGFVRAAAGLGRAHQAGDALGGHLSQAATRCRRQAGLARGWFATHCAQ